MLIVRLFLHCVYLVISSLADLHKTSVVDPYCSNLKKKNDRKKKPVIKIQLTLRLYVYTYKGLSHECVLSRYRRQWRIGQSDKFEDDR